MAQIVNTNRYKCKMTKMYTFVVLIMFNLMMGFQRTEFLGLSLAAFSVVLPYIGQFLKVITFLKPFWLLIGCLNVAI